MTKKQVEKRIKDILSKNPRLKGAKVTINFTDKKKEKSSK